MVAYRFLLLCGLLSPLNCLAERLIPVAEQELFPVAGQWLGKHHRHVDEEDESQNKGNFTEPSGEML